MTSIQVPRLLNDATPKVSSIAPTLRTPAAAAGYRSRAPPSFPAAAITRTPAARASSIASLSTADSWVPLATKDRVMMSAPLFAAQRIPSAISLLFPLAPFITRTSSRSAFQSKPAVPMALSLIAPINPAIKVPWLVECTAVGPSPHPGMRRTRPVRSGCESSTPVSTIAMVIPGAPVVTSHAA